MLYLQIDRQGSIQSLDESALAHFHGPDDAPVLEVRSGPPALEELFDQDTVEALIRKVGEGFAPQSGAATPVVRFAGMGKRAGRIPFPIELTVVASGTGQFTVVVDARADVGLRSRLAAMDAGTDLLREALVVTDGTIDDEGPRILHANRAFATLVGRTLESVVGRSARSILGSTRWNRIRSLIVAGSPNGEVIARQSVFSRPGEDDVLIDWELLSLRDESGNLSNLIAVLRIVEELESPGAADGGNRRDFATGLPSQEFFVNRLGRSIQWARRFPSYTFAVICVEMGGLREIRRRVGTTVATQILKAAGWRLRRALRPMDMVARMGNDRLVIILEKLGSPHEIDQVLARIRSQLAPPYHVGGEAMSIRTFTGVAFSDTGYELPEKVIQDLGSAITRARRETPAGGFAVFDLPRYEYSRARAQRVADFRSAISNDREDRLLLLYQPIFRLDRPQPVAVEALLRWREAEGGVTPPLEILPILETSRLITGLGRRVVARVLAQIGRWREKRGSSFSRISVNLSATEFMDPGLHVELGRLLQAQPEAGTSLAFELSARTLDGDREAIRRYMDPLVQSGVEFWLDGIGFDGVAPATLADLPVQRVKVHPSIVAGLSNGAVRQSHRILRSIQGMADAFEMETIAVGIETELQLERVRDLGITTGQGFLLSELLDADAAFASLSNSQRGP